MKTTKLTDIAVYLNKLLEPDKYPEKSFLNGLQVEGNLHVSKIAGIVSPNIKVFQKAIKATSELIIAHHGLFRIESSGITGLLKNRLTYLLKNNISYISYHIPLDCHEKYGNNIQIAQKLGLKNTKSFGEYFGNKLGKLGNLNTPVANKKDLYSFLYNKLKNKPLEIIWPKSVRKIENIAVISGNGARRELIEDAKIAQADAYLTGSIDEGIMSIAEELNIVYIAAGHYNTEKWGVVSLGNHLSKKFGLEFAFIEDETEKW